MPSPTAYPHGDRTKYAGTVVALVCLFASGCGRARVPELEPADAHVRDAQAADGYVLPEQGPPDAHVRDAQGSRDSAAQEGGAACAAQAAGVYAFRTEMEVWWMDESDAVVPLVDPSRATVSLYFKGTLADFRADGREGSAVLESCGLDLPPVLSYIDCGAFAMEFPDGAWDLASMPSIRTRASFSGSDVGDSLTLEVAPLLLGMALSDPTDSWPAAGDTGRLGCPGDGGSECFVDHDGDGEPGITAVFGRLDQRYSTGGCGINDLRDVIYRGPPLDDANIIDGNRERAEEAGLGLRMFLGGSATRTSCGSGVGTAASRPPELRLSACRSARGSRCTAAQARFLAQTIPGYHPLAEGEAPPLAVMRSTCECEEGCGGPACPLEQEPSAGPRLAFIRLGDTTDAAELSCANVRGAPFPDLD